VGHCDFLRFGIGLNLAVLLVSANWVQLFQCLSETFIGVFQALVVSALDSAAVRLQALWEFTMSHARLGKLKNLGRGLLISFISPRDSCLSDGLLVVLI
jgi:hypothetical protein